MSRAGLRAPRPAQTPLTSDLTSGPRRQQRRSFDVSVDELQRRAQGRPASRPAGGGPVRRARPPVHGAGVPTSRACATFFFFVRKDDAEDILAADAVSDGASVYIGPFRRYRPDRASNGKVTHRRPMKYSSCPVSGLVLA